MNATILNRDFTHPSDGWYMIEPRGEHPNRDANVIQVIDDESANSVVNRFNLDAAAGALSHGHEMLIDHEHFKHDAEKETRAYGWLTHLANRADGIYGQIRWTTTGKAAVDGGDYRFFSTEYDPRDLKILNSVNSVNSVKRIRPLRLDGLTLTNSPNNKGGKPITNRKDFRPGMVPAADEPTNTKDKMKSVCTRLGLSADASEDAVLAELNKLFNRTETAEKAITELPTLKNRNTELETRNTELLGEQVDALLDAHGVKEEKIRNRARAAILPLKNREERVSFLTDFGFKPVEAGKPQQQQRGSVILNRGESKTPGERASVATEQVDEQALANKAEAEVQSYKLMNRCTYTEARNAVRMQKPELFGVASTATN